MMMTLTQGTVAKRSVTHSLWSIPAWGAGSYTTTGKRKVWRVKPRYVREVRWF